ncbi:MAG: glycosyltransferase family 2 protein [Desulfuromonadales bacterium]|nr:glycosyltransferase family 2 protein [Desulfuromonadales bacterium]
MTFLLFGSIAMILYIYLGYPALVRALAARRPRPVAKADITPPVTILIAAFNEESCIAQTVRNKLALDYPSDRLQVVVVSDGSTDRTEAEVRAIDDPRVRLLRQEPRAGKTAALNRAVSESGGEILVFSDANSLYRPDALRCLVRSFADPQVGYVTGRMVYQAPEATAVEDGCSAYMRYENSLREAETAIGSVIGVDGGIDAVRRHLYREMRPDQLPDFVLPLSVAAQGYRVIYEPEAVLTEASLHDSGDEYRMRVRVSLRALWALRDMRQLLSLRRHPLFAWQLWSHKLLRYLAFFFLLTAWGSNAWLWSKGALFQGLFLLQSGAYAGAFLYLLAQGVQRLRLVRFFFYFVLVNLAAAHAFGKFLLGRKKVLWTPRKG